MGTLWMMDRKKKSRFALLRARKRKCGLWENILLSKCEIRTKAATVSQWGVLYGITVIWVCSLSFIRNKGLLSF